jgi:hypothetical protein
VRIRDLNRRFGGLQVSPRLTAGLHATVTVLPTPFNTTEALAASLSARDADDSADAAPLPVVTAEGRLAATWAENPDAARA